MEIQLVPLNERLFQQKELDHFARGDTRRIQKKLYSQTGGYWPLQKKMSINKNAIVEKQDLLCRLMPNKLSFKHEYKK